MKTKEISKNPRGIMHKKIIIASSIFATSNVFAMRCQLIHEGHSAFNEGLECTYICSGDVTEHYHVPFGHCPSERF